MIEYLLPQLLSLSLSLSLSLNNLKLNNDLIGWTVLGVLGALSSKNFSNLAFLK